MQDKIKIYLDNAASTPIREEVLAEMTECMKSTFGNPSATHVYGREAKAKVERARKKIAELLNAQSNEIIFTSCGTESNNLIIRSSVDYLGVERIITSDLEHKSVVLTVEEVCKIRDVELVKVNTDSDGIIDYLDLDEKLKSSSKKTLVCLMHANNEIGNLTDLEKVQKLCEENEAFFHTDAVQTMGHYPFDFKSLKVDFASASAHKFHGPKGTGFAFIRKSTGFSHPQVIGGGQERNLRSGTENIYGIVGMTKALELSYEELDEHRSHIEGLKKYTKERLLEKLPGIEFNGRSGDMDQSLYTVLSVRLPFRDDLIGFELELNGLAVSQGSACSSGAIKTSSVMNAILTDEQINNTTPLRISFSYMNTKEEIDLLADVLKKVADKHMVSQ